MVVKVTISFMVKMVTISFMAAKVTTSSTAEMTTTSSMAATEMIFLLERTVTIPCKAEPVTID